MASQSRLLKTQRFDPIVMLVTASVISSRKVPPLSR